MGYQDNIPYRCWISGPLSFKKSKNENHFHCLCHSPHFGIDPGTSGKMKRKCDLIKKPQSKYEEEYQNDDEDVLFPSYLG